MSGQRDEGGRYTSAVSDDNILHYFETGQRDFYSAQEIADAFDIGRSQAHRRLNQLDESEELERVEMGKRNVVWWRPRDVVVLIPEKTGYSIVDPETGVASQGESRTEALRMLAEAIDVHHGDSEMAPEEILEELNLDADQLPENAAPPWE